MVYSTSCSESSLRFISQYSILSSFRFQYNVILTVALSAGLHKTEGIILIGHFRKEEHQTGQILDQAVISQEMVRPPRRQIKQEKPAYDMGHGPCDFKRQHYLRRVLLRTTSIRFMD